MRAPWLGDVLHDAGLTVATPVGNPVGRGRAMRTIYGVVAHDTVTSRAWADLSVARMLRDGHANLSGPLYQLGVRRNGTVDWIADGRSNHNGHGTWGNDAIGIGVYCNGGATPNEPWNPQQRETVIVAARAILARLDLARSSHWNPRVAGHKETDPGRKQDPFGIDMPAVRRDVERGARPVPQPTVPQPPALSLIEELMAEAPAELAHLATVCAGMQQAAVLAGVRRMRADVGLDPDPVSDAISAGHIIAGRRSWHETAERLADKAAETDQVDA